MSNVELLATELYSKNKIKSITFWDKMDLLSVGLVSGHVVNYIIQVETLGYMDDSDDDEESKYNQPRNSKSRPSEQRTLEKEGHEIAKHVYM